jgi:hypothetical protein
MSCLICGKPGEEEVCSYSCVNALENVRMYLLKWFLQNQQIPYLRALEEKGTSDIEDVKRVEKKAEVVEEPMDEAQRLSKIWDEIPVAAHFTNMPTGQKKGHRVAIILRAKRGQEYKEIGKAVDEETRDELFDRCWKDELTLAGYTPDFKEIY